jgi:Domain of unknown function (DUF4157)
MNARIALSDPKQQTGHDGLNPVARENVVRGHQMAGAQSLVRQNFCQVPLHHGKLLQTKSCIGSNNDPLEFDADRAANNVMNGGPAARINSLAPPHSNGTAKGNDGTKAISNSQGIERGLRSPGQPLDPSTRSFMEPRFGRDFSNVRVHTDPAATASARSVNALAFTVGNNIVFGAGQYSPSTSHGRSLVAHELAHVVQQRANGNALLQCKGPATTGKPIAAAPPPPPREDYVFIMGQDVRGRGNPFYTLAERFYRSHVPKATFVTNIRNLADLLNYIHGKIPGPIGNLYIVSHANEDGTLSFGLNSTDPDSHLSFPELRDAVHPKGGGASTLEKVSAQIDTQTRIHIKGCDIGRSQQMVELVDEAFGGAGTVTAPTHEQDFSIDPTLAQAEEKRVRASRITAFEAKLPALPPEPPAVDPKLKGDARKIASRERAAALITRKQAIQQRKQSIQQEGKRITPEVKKAGEVAGTVESFSGPMFQRPGTKLFIADEVSPEVDRLYSHLSTKQRSEMVRRLIARDPRARGLAQKQGTFQQHGQRVDHFKAFSQRFIEPRSLTEASRALSAAFRSAGFRPAKLLPSQQTGTKLVISLEGRFTDSSDTIFTWTETVPDDATILARGKEQVAAPGHYAWRVEHAHSNNGETTVSAIGERVVAYLHHASLDASLHQHFTRPESDRNFYATSTFAPPKPPPAPRGAKKP